MRFDHFQQFRAKVGRREHVAHANHVFVAGHGDFARNVRRSDDDIRAAQLDDIWSNFQADPQEIRVLWEIKKDRLKYGFKPFIWQVGGKFTWPLDKDNFEYHYPRGFDDCFTIEPDLPFKSFL